MEARRIALLSESCTESLKSPGGDLVKDIYTDMSAAPPIQVDLQGLVLTSFSSMEDWLRTCSGQKDGARSTFFIRTHRQLPYVQRVNQESWKQAGPGNDVVKGKE